MLINLLSCTHLAILSAGFGQPSLTLPHDFALSINGDLLQSTTAIENSRVLVPHRLLQSSSPSPTAFQPH